MRIRVLMVGKVRERFLEEGAEEYRKRLRPYTRLEFLHVADKALPARGSAAAMAEVMAREGERLLRGLAGGEYVIALDRQGRQMPSEAFADFLQQRALAGESHLAFVIGGTLGLSDAVLQRADCTLSLGPMTFPHQMVPLLLLEQIYRGFKITAGEPYHR